MPRASVRSRPRGPHCAGSLHHLSGASMGLAERRAAKEFETKRFPQLKKDIDDAAGFEVPVTVAWDTLAKEGEAHLYDDCWPKVYFQPLVAAFKGITIDDMGK